MNQKIFFFERKKIKKLKNKNNGKPVAKKHRAIFDWNNQNDEDARMIKLFLDSGPEKKLEQILCAL